MLRIQGIFSLSEVAFAIFETNGSLSVLRKPGVEPPTRQDLKLSCREPRLPCSLVEDGAVCQKNLAGLGKDEAWLTRLLKEQGHEDIRSVAYAELDQAGGLAVIRKARG
ncbi:hypothetical protein D3C73_1465780 [compost metagenome]